MTGGKKAAYTIKGTRRGVYGRIVANNPDVIERKILTGGEWAFDVVDMLQGALHVILVPSWPMSTFAVSLGATHRRQS